MVSRILSSLTAGGYQKRDGRRLVLLRKLPADW